MKSIFFVIAAGLLASATAASAASPFDGTWQFDISAAKLPAQPFTVTIKDGQFDCVSCDPRFSVPADGKYHALPNDKRADEGAVTIVDPHTIRIDYRKGGELLYTETDRVAPDGNSLTYTSTSHTTTNGQASTETGTQVRVGAIDPAAHLASGSWRTIKLASETPSSYRITFKLVHQQLTVSNGVGAHFTATLGGPFVPMEGTRIPAMVAVRQTGPRTLVEIFQRDGKTRTTNTVTIAGNGNTATLTSKDASNGSVTTFPGKRI